MAESLMQTYARLPVSFERGEGAWLWDTDGKRYLDAVSGIAVCSLGHAHPALTEALYGQAQRLWHTSNLYDIPRQDALGDELTRLAGMDRAFFCNSGAEANEAAIKIARKYGHQRDINKPTIVVMDQSFHGRTLATLSATGNRKAQAGFEPLVSGFVRIPYGDIEALEVVANNNPDVVAVLVEPLQGEGGVNLPPQGYLEQLRSLCDTNQWLLMLDEIQTGMGRTGKFFAFQHTDIQPDVITLAKALGNGMPIGACLAQGEAAEVLQAGNHGSTFGGNPLACATAHAVVRTIKREKLVQRASELGERIRKGLNYALTDVEGVVEIRGQGLMIGIELDRPCGQLVQQALAEGLLINVTAERVVRLLPPLILDNDTADLLVDQVAGLIKSLLITG